MKNKKRLLEAARWCAKNNCSGCPILNTKKLQCHDALVAAVEELNRVTEERDGWAKAASVTVDGMQRMSASLKRTGKL